MSVIEEKKCLNGGCAGYPTVGGQCPFHYATRNDPEHSSAMSVLLKNNPIYHAVLNASRQCIAYDPPNNRDEWRLVHSCATLLEAVGELPEGFTPSNRRQFIDAIDGKKRERFNGKHIDATWIGINLENYIVKSATEEAQRLMENISNKESFVHDFISGGEESQEKRKTVYTKSDFDEFMKLSIFNRLRQADKEAASEQ